MGRLRDFGGGLWGTCDGNDAIAWGHDGPSSGETEFWTEVSGPFDFGDSHTVSQELGRARCIDFAGVGRIRAWADVHGYPGVH